MIIVGFEFEVKNKKESMKLQDAILKRFGDKFHDVYWIDERGNLLRASEVVLSFFS